MWLYTATILTVVAYVACSDTQMNSKKRIKQNTNRIAETNPRRRFRLSSDDMEEIQMPLKIPKLSRAEKIALIVESGQNPFEKKRHYGRRRKGRRRPRHLHKRHRNNAYHLLYDDDDDIERRWNQETRNAVQWDNEEQQKHEQDKTGVIDNLSNESEMKATTKPKYDPYWETTTEPYDNLYWKTSTSNYWETTKSPPYVENMAHSYWDTSAEPHWETTTSSFWDTSTFNHQETFTNWENEGTVTYWSEAVPTTNAITDGAVSVWESDIKTTSKEPLWRQLFVTTPTSTVAPNLPLALPMANCPHRFDAVTRAFNGRTYVFARDRVYQLWRHDNLHQKASFFVNEMFPDGPRTVTVAYTNQRSGVTVLIEHKTVYRYRWNRKNKVFYLARKSPQPLTSKMPVYPRAGFQWIDGNQVLVEGDNFATYDAYWNVATFSGLISNYFPHFPRDLIGMAYQSNSLFLLFTASNKVQIYDTVKYRVLQEYPIEISEYVGCSKG